MPNGVTTTGIKGNTYETLFRRQIKRTKPPAVGMAVAYVSQSGFNLVNRILHEGGVKEVRLVTDTKDRVTHPKALQRAVDSGWNVRVVDDLTGTFHPKLYVGGAGFGGPAGVADLSLAIMGSPNMSRNGFRRNGECVFWSVTPHAVKSAGRAWRDCWRAGVPATAAKLFEYERAFALRNRFRKPQDLVALGVVDDLPAQVDGLPKKSTKPPKTELKAISETAASVAWAGLQSFTGEYTLQVEFPERSGAGTAAHRRGSRARPGRPDTVCGWGDSHIQISLLQGQRYVSPQHSECDASCQLGAQAQERSRSRGVQRGGRGTVFQDTSAG